jgi:hypothetical protein
MSSAPSLFNRAIVRINGKCAIIDVREPQQPAGTLCDYFRGKPLDRNTACTRPGCGRPWSEHYPEYKPRRVRGVIAAVCNVCSQPLDSEAHLNHCNG